MSDLSLETASGLLAGSPAAHLLADLRSRLAEAHTEHPQRALLASHGLDLVEAGLHTLAGLGHKFWLTDADPEASVAFPKMLYRDIDGDLQTTEAADKEGLDALMAAGWRDHPDEALATKPKAAAPVKKG